MSLRNVVPEDSAEISVLAGAAVVDVENFIGGEGFVI